MIYGMISHTFAPLSASVRGHNYRQVIFLDTNISAAAAVVIVHNVGLREHKINCILMVNVIASLIRVFSGLSRHQESLQWSWRFLRHRILSSGIFVSSSTIFLSLFTASIDVVTDLPMCVLMGGFTYIVFI